MVCLQPRSCIHPPAKCRRSAPLKNILQRTEQYFSSQSIVIKKICNDDDMAAHLIRLVDGMCPFYELITQMHLTNIWIDLLGYVACEWPEG